MIRKVLLDTNFLLIPSQYKVDIFEELDRILDFPYDIYIPDLCIAELKKLASSNSKTASAAKIGLQFIQNKGIKTLHTGKDTHPDNIFFDYPDHIIATRDLALAKKLKEHSIEVITLRQKSHLTLIVP